MSKEASGETEKLMDSLTTIQKNATLWDEGPFLLLAGPGSGKTRVLTTRIARLLTQSSGASFRILALTFTNRAADEMRDRITEIAPDSEKRLYIGTFHSFCTDILRQYGLEIGLGSDFKIYSAQEDRLELLEESLRGKSVHIPENVKLLPLIDRIRDRLLEPAEIISSFRNIELGENVAEAYKAYDSYLIKQNAQDFNALLLNAYRLFIKFPAVAKRYRNAYKYWNIDEFQDTNSGQYKLLKTMAKDEFKNIFIVADDDQIIYQWNGASHERLEEFTKDFSPTILQLPTNFRCPPKIVDIANKLISHNLLRSKNKKPLESKWRTTSETEEIIRVLEFENQNEEANGVAKLVKQYKDTGKDGIAVLARTRALLEKALTAIKKYSLHARIVQRRDDFQTDPFIWLHACLQQSNNRSDIRNLEKLIGTFNRLMDLDLPLGDIVSEAEATEGDLLRTWARTVKENDQSTTDAINAAEQVSKLLVQNTDYQKFIKFVLDWIEKIADPEDVSNAFSLYTEDKKAWRSLHREIRGSVGDNASLEVFLQELELRSKDLPPSPSEITLMTIHGSKGNEFNHVILIGLAEDILPSFQSLKAGPKSPELEEERRNCFVAITRAKKSLVLSYAKNYRNWSKKPSRFLEEMELPSPSN